MKDKDIDFDNLIQIFNNDGIKAAKEYIKETYNASYTVVQRRIKEETNYYFNRSTRKYELINGPKASFMTLEELYMDKSKSNEDRPDIRLNSHPNEDIFKDIIVNLMKDKMQEMSKYIHLEQSTKLVLISIKRLEENGYKVILD